MPAVTPFAVIMAGGAGERFWPLSRQARPKQLLHLTDPDKSMLAETVDRLTPLVPAERIYVITSRALVASIQAASLGLPAENIVGEPCKRNTTGALAWITAHILARHPQLAPEHIALAIVTADHRIGAPEVFRAMISTALAAGAEAGALVTCGIVPGHPETGFGYIQAGDAVPAHDGVFRVRAFHEKPNREKAEEFIASGTYFWNSGMFFWTAQAFLHEMALARTEVADAIGAMRAALSAGDTPAAEAAFASLEDISIDYALMERSRNVLMVRGTFPWADVGSWSSIEPILAKDTKSNAVHGHVVLHDCEGCIIYNEATPNGVTIAAAGLEDIVVVATADAILVLPKNRAQDVRHIVAELKKGNAPQV